MAELTIQEKYEAARDHYHAGRLQMAEVLVRQILALDSRQGDALYMLGRIAYQTGHMAQAAELIRTAVSIRPADADAHYDLGQTLEQLGRMDGAIDEFRRAVELNPNLAEAHCNLGTLLNDKGEIEAAISHYRRALEIMPDQVEAQYNLGVVLKNEGRIPEALACWKRAVELRPDFIPAWDNYLLFLQCDPGAGPEMIAAEHRRWNHACAARFPAATAPRTNNRDPDRRLRVGYVSADFCNNVCAAYLLPLLENHNPDQVEIFCYAEVPSPDDITTRMQKSADHWRSTVNVPDHRIAAQIRQDQIDILVDLKLHTAGNRLPVFASRPAPVQATWLGYPGSTGLTTMDYRLSDPYLDPPGIDESIYSEKTVRLPHTFWCYDPLEARDISVNALPALSTGAITFGCLNNHTKLNDVVLKLWAQVLVGVENSRLMLLVAGERFRRSITDFLAREGVSPERVMFSNFLPMRDYMRLYHQVDIALDCFPYNGHTTSLDAMWMGVPVVTLCGKTAVSRAGFSQLSNLKLTEFVAHEPEEYVRLAAELARDLKRVGQLRSSLREMMLHSPLMETARFARDMEAAYRRMWQMWCAY